jgi:hypothetical protein
MDRGCKLPPLAALRIEPIGGLLAYLAATVAEKVPAPLVRLMRQTRPVISSFNKPPPSRQHFTFTSHHSHQNAIACSRFLRVHIFFY